VKLGRRDFLRTIPTAAVAGALPAWLSGCAIPDRPAGPEAPTLPPRGAPEKHVMSVCGACPGGCGIRARVVAGRLVGISGNPLHPVNRGALCPLGLAGAHVLYHPDRLRGPLRRAGDSYRPVSWKEAIAEVAGRLADLRARGLSHTVALVDGTRGRSRDVAQRFLAAYGSPNHLCGRPWNDVVSGAALRAMQGVEGPAAYDLENARFVLAFGSGWLEGSWSPVGAARAYGLARRGRKARRVRVVHVEPRLSTSAALADQWIPVIPGSEGALALGLIHMALREGLEDRAFLDGWSQGFDLLRAQLLRDYHPDAVSERTGVPVATIIRLARDFASNRPAVAVGDDFRGPGAQSTETRMAIHALNAIVGAVGSPGGVLCPPAVPTPAMPAPPDDEQSRRGGGMAPIAGDPGAGVLQLMAWQDGRGSYPVNLLLAYDADPLGALGGGRAAREALRRAPFLVSFSSFWDETARIADLVLPEPTYLERWQDDPCFTSRGFPVIGLRQPVVKPRHDTRPAPEALREIARAVGGSTAAALPERDFAEIVQDAMRGVHGSGRGALLDVPEAAAWVGTMEKSGWRASQFGSFDDFWKGLCERGGWWDPVYDFGERSRTLRTASGKFEFGPLARSLEPPPKPRPPAADYPLRLHAYPLYAAFGYSLGPMPWVQDTLGRGAGQSWTLWIEIAQEDARSLGVRDGARVRVQSPCGSVEARARIYPGLRPGVVAMPLGPGGAGGRACKRALAETAGALFGLSRSAAGAPRFEETWVRVAAA
jgi:menaquinone reductase, molybdopterin-binding-like subunit